MFTNMVGHVLKHLMRPPGRALLAHSAAELSDPPGPWAGRSTNAVPCDVDAGTRQTCRSYIPLFYRAP
jgi:hypothetical protein